MIWFLVLSVLWVFILAQIILYFKSLDVLGDWEANRCNPVVMFTASSYGKDARENFSYCTSRLAASVLTTVFAPARAIMSTLLTSADQSIASVGVANSTAKRLFNGLQAILQTVINRYQNTFLQLRMGMQRLATATARMNAAGVAAVYMGISMVQGFFSAYDFVKNVVMIILGVLVALIFFLFFALLPVIPLILSVIAAVGAGAGMASEFCFDASTEVLLANGNIKKIYDVKIGDVLSGGGVVESTYKLNGGGVRLYSYNGVIVSGSHLILHESRWMPVAAVIHSAAVQGCQTRLYCLTTSNRIIPVRSRIGLAIFRDYEEIADDKMYKWWYEAVAGAIGMQDTDVIDEQEGLHPDTLIDIAGWGIVPLNAVNIGQHIKDIAGYTEIIGIVKYGVGGRLYNYNGDVLGGEIITANGMKWRRTCYVGSESGSTPSYMIGIFTKSGTFMSARGNMFRDAREHDGSIDAEYMKKLLVSLNVAACST